MSRALVAAFRLAGLALAFALLAAWLLQSLPPFLKILPASLFLVSVARPAAGLLILAGVGPMANAVALWAHSPLPGIRMLEQLVLAFVAGAGLRWWRGGPELRLAEPAALLAASAAASFIAVQPALLMQRVPEMTAVDHLRALLVNGDYFLRSGLWDPLFFAALAIEGLALAVTAERIVRRHAEAAEGALRMAIVGHAGVAALNVQQLIGAGIRAGGWLRELPRLVRDVRVSLFYDVNAAGSVFLLTLLSGIGVLKTAARIRWELAVLLALLALGLWMAGSRVALLALAVTMTGMFVILAWTRRGAVRWIAAAAIAGIVIAGALAAALYPETRNMSLGPAAAARRILAHVSLNMWRAAPIFGIGVGRFYEESSRFGGDALRRELGFVTINENAHNYFLQTLSTEGVVGFAALLLVLAAGIMPAVRTQRAAPTWLRRWLLAGVAGYLLTWLTGHPQLVPEAAMAFWLLFGVLAALSSPATIGVWRAPVLVVATLIILTAPIRTAQAIRHADFEHIALGLTPWQPEIDGIRYRLAGEAFSMYLPADGTAVDLPLRRSAFASDPLVVTISQDGRKLYEPLISGDAWQQIRVQLPKSSRRYARVDFTVRPARPDGSRILCVGKAERR